MDKKHTSLNWEIRHYAGKTEIRATGEGQHMGHTWIVAEVFGASGEPYVGHGSPEANAEFIVRACNSYYELLDALKNLLAVKNGEDGTKYNSDEIARAAIDKATRKIEKID